MKITNESMGRIDGIFSEAYDNGRTVLYEYEVYDILKNIGLTVPKYQFVESEEELTDEMLKEFGQEIIIKIVSPDIAHKQKLGGVKKVHNHDLMFLRYSLNAMGKEVLSHFDENEKPRVKGYLLVEFLEFSQSLGYEILFGIKEDVSFGPILTLSKGGDDAEFFAKYYDPANLYLPHFSYEQSVELVDNLSIAQKFKSIGHPEYLDEIAKAATLVSSLAYNYSPVSESNPKYYISQMDLNPFVITKDGRFVAVDGFAVFEKVEEEKEMPVVNTNHLEPFFNPKGIAVLGVSSNTNKYNMAKDIVKLLHDLGREDLYCINPKGGEITLEGKKYPLYESLDHLPSEVELVVYAAPAKHIVPFFKSLKNIKNVPDSVVLIPGIPSEIKYKDFAAQLHEVLPEGVRIVGPNCMGVYYAPDAKNKGVNTLFIEEERLHVRSTEKSNTALLTQSGGVAITLIDKLEHSPIFKSIVSFGNKFDVNITDLMAYFNNDDNIEVIAIYVEGFDGLEGRRFFELASEIDKPIVVYKSGKTDAGAKAAASHTAAMTGDYDVFKAVCDQSGILLVEDIKAYYDVLKAFSLLGSGKKPGGMNVAGVMNAGFEATVAADELGELKPAKFSEATKKRLDEINTHGLMDTNTSILDVTPMTDDVMYGQIIEALLQDDGVDSVFVGVVPHVENIKATPELCHDEKSLSNILIDLYNRYDKPMVVSVNAGEYYDEFVTMMEEAGLPVYSDIRSAVKVLEKVSTYYTK